MLQGKNAIITGSSRGIGSAIAVALAKKGVNCAIIGRNKWCADVTAHECHRQGTKPIVYNTDLSCIKDTNFLIDAIKKHWKDDINIIIHSASFVKLGGITDYSDKELELVNRINYVAPLQINKNFLKSKHLNSILSHSPPVNIINDFNNVFPYIMSKVALTTMTQDIYFKYGVQSNSYWNQKVIQSEFSEKFELGDYIDRLKPSILADTVIEILENPSINGEQIVDIPFLKARRKNFDLSKYYNACRISEPYDLDQVINFG